jgi:sucrose-6-phosphate hydrolase SacC (GH32 family)
LTTFDTVIYASMDFKIWYKIDTQPGFARGECPSFFPLPRTTPGAGPAPAEAETPTHVHKASHGGDWMNVGTYVPGEQGKVGTFSQTPGVPFTETKIDMGKYYASKDFYDPAKKRRINWGWAQVAPGSTQSMPREVTWNPELQQLVHSPIEEQANLREDAIGSLKSQTLPAGKVVSLGLPQKLGNQSEIRVSFARPSVSTTLSVKVMGNGGSLKPPYAREMPGYDLAGGDYSVTNVDYKDFKICEAACDADDKCVSWTYVVRGPKYASCCLKGNVPKSSQKSTCTSGVKSMDSELTGGTDFSIDYRPNEDGKISSVKVHGGSFSDTLKLSPNDKTIDMDLYVDNTFTEAYFMNGRVAMTVPTGATNDAAVGVSSSADGVTMNSATAWHVSPIWVTPEDVKKTPRLDRQPIITV